MTHSLALADKRTHMGTLVCIYGQNGHSQLTPGQVGGYATKYPLNRAVVVAETTLALCSCRALRVGFEVTATLTETHRAFRPNVCYVWFALVTPELYNGT